MNKTNILIVLLITNHTHEVVMLLVHICVLVHIIVQTLHAFTSVSKVYTVLAYILLKPLRLTYFKISNIQGD